MSDSTSRGRFVWHELMTTNTKSAADFFSQVAGWKPQPWGEDPPYTVFMAGGKSMAGLMALPEAARAMGAPPSWLTYISTPDVDNGARQVVSLGGKVVKEAADIPTIGRFAVVQDPQGAVFALFKPLGGSPSDGDPALGDYSWHELMTTDWRAALSFYKQMFGWEETGSMDMGPGMGMYQMFGWNGRPRGGIFNKSSQQPGPPSWLPYVHVPDSKKTAEVIKKLGGKIINGPMEVPGGDWIVAGLDREGVAFAVHSLKPAAKPAAPPAKQAAGPAKKAAPVKKAAPAKKAAPVKKAAPIKKAAKSVKKATTPAKKAAPAKKAGRAKVKRAAKRAGKAGGQKKASSGRAARKAGAAKKRR